MEVGGAGQASAVFSGVRREVEGKEVRTTMKEKLTSRIKNETQVSSAESQLISPVKRKTLHISGVSLSFVVVTCVMTQTTKKKKACFSLSVFLSLSKCV